MDGQGISIHAPLTGSDRHPISSLSHHPYFNPRSPYGERQIIFKIGLDRKNFNPRSPYGERHTSSSRRLSGGDFNPRSPYGERHPVRQRDRKVERFQSTLPLRGATGLQALGLQPCAISIHAPLTGSDQTLHYLGTRRFLFQSTLPLRGATAEGIHSHCPRAISIHAPLTGSD